MPNSQIIGTALAALAIAVISGVPAKVTAQSRISWGGCWSAWENPSSPLRRMVGFLRLHADNGNAYAGPLVFYDQNYKSRLELHLSFASDGSHAVAVKGGETFEFTPDPTNEIVRADGGYRAKFKSLAPDKSGRISVSGGKETLSLTIQIRNAITTFHGVRDGCD